MCTLSTLGLLYDSNKLQICDVECVKVEQMETERRYSLLVEDFATYILKYIANDSLAYPHNKIGFKGI